MNVAERNRHQDRTKGEDTADLADRLRIRFDSEELADFFDGFPPLDAPGLGIGVPTT